MIIPDTKDLPQYATRPEWCKLLSVSDKALITAESKGLESVRPNKRTVVYAKDAILGYFTRDARPARSKKGKN
jgi:hypothetical protein